MSNSDTGDLPARMAAEMERHGLDETTGSGDHRCDCGEIVTDWDEHLAAAAVSVYWEDNARTKAENERLRERCTCGGTACESALCDCDAIPCPVNHRAEWAEGEVERLRAELAEAREERDLAIAHDRQPYPTAWAYEQACKALETHRQRANTAEAERDEVLREFAEERKTLDRVRTVAAEWGEPYHCGWLSASVLVRQLRAALDAPETPGDAATDG